MGCAVQAGASLVKSASGSNLGHLVQAYAGQPPFAPQLPTLHAAKEGADDGAAAAPSHAPLKPSSACARPNVLYFWPLCFARTSHVEYCVRQSSL